MSSTPEYEFEVAFSFLQQDEGLAFEINDLIQDRYKTFIYSLHQKELIGTDGEKKFNEIFGEKARLVVVLYREGWGQTSWTRIEETAIRNSAHENGYDFTTFVQLAKESQMPKWLPKPRIYYDFDRWGTKGFAPVIEARINEAGGQNKPESVEDQIARLERKLILQKERENYLNSPIGYAQAQIEFDKLFALLKAKTNSLQSSGSKLRYGFQEHPGNSFILDCGYHSLHFYWQYRFANSLDESTLRIVVSTFSGAPLTFILERQTQGYANDSIELEAEYNFDINPVINQTGWSSKSNYQDFFLSEDLMNYWLKIFFDKISNAELS